MKKPTHGGPRKGAGRKKGYRKPKALRKEKTKAIRVPIGALDAVYEVIERYKESKK